MKNLIKYTIGLIILIPLSIALGFFGIIFLVFELLASFVGLVLYGYMGKEWSCSLHRIFLKI